MKEEKRWMRGGKPTTAAVSTGQSGRRVGVIMADVFLQMSQFLLRLIRSTRTQRLIESSGLDRLSLGRTAPVRINGTARHSSPDDTVKLQLYTAEDGLYKGEAHRSCEQGRARRAHQQGDSGGSGNGWNGCRHQRPPQGSD
ncbi:hypothetical protein Q8A67_025617 [Cirrhinus molitorella]|uniref:Uncharacterized protein n=1 Tax=Cirrhinus molitorella TaxID=172907 RepID=A0AA88NWG2_9TELE|nr:hypothetical protein Q8A67_025617 [Cirrhinus molitorella]